MERTLRTLTSTTGLHVPVDSMCILFLFLSTCHETAPYGDKETEALLPSYSNPRQKEGTKLIKTEFLIRQIKFPPKTLAMYLWSQDKHPVLTRALLVDTWDHFRHTSRTMVAYHSSFLKVKTC